MPGGQDLRDGFLTATDQLVVIVSRDDVATTWGEPRG